MKTTKRALFSSVMALILCFSMLVGTTFAWFTDSVESGVNQIIAGNLDVEVYYGDPAAKASIQDITTLFDDVNGQPILWEPGAVAFEKLTVANEGTLALKYQMAINFTNENEINGTGAKLSQILKIAVVDAGALTSREAALAAAKTAPDAATLHDFVLSGELAATTQNTYGIVIWWEPSANDNNWNVNNGKTTSDSEKFLHIDLGIKLVATQVEGEFDSFGDDYDENAWHPDMKVYSANDLKSALYNGKTNITLMGDIDLDEELVLPDGVVMDMNGCTLSVQELSSEGTLAISNGTLVMPAEGCVYANGNQNITLENVVIDSDGLSVEAYTGGTVKLKNVTLRNTSVSNPVQNYGGTLILENVTVSQKGDANTPWYSSALQVINVIKWNEEAGRYQVVSQANTTVNGGTYTGKKALMISAPGGNVTINGGTFEGSEYAIQADFAPQNYLDGRNYESVIIVNGGTFKGNIKVSASAKLEIKGGTFTANPSAYVAYGYHALQAGDMYFVVPKGISNVVTSLDELQAALNAASASDNHIVLTADITGDVIVSQKEGVNITIDGKGYQYDGTIYVYGNSRNTGAETLTIKNVNFITTGEVTRDFIHSYGDNTKIEQRYARNVTIEDCTFTNENGGTVVAARFRQAYNITMKNCTVKGTFSPMWTTGVQGLTIQNVTADCANEGMTIGASNNVLIENCTITVPGANSFGIRTDATDGYKLTVNNCTLNVAKPIVIRGSSDTYTVIVDGGKYVSTTQELIDAIKNAPVNETTYIAMADGNYDGNIDITVAAMGKQGGDVVIKAMEGAKPVITGTVTLGYREQTVGSTMYEANVTFEGITFSHVDTTLFSIEVGDVKSLNLVNCTIIGSGETGIHAARGNGTGPSKITGCTFINAALQGYGNYCTDMLIEKCTFNNSCINIQAGNGVTIRSCIFNSTLADANNNESFYVIRSNSTPITVTGCTINIDSTVTGTGVAGAKGWGVFVNRGTTNWTVSDVEITRTEAAQLQTALEIAKCTSTGVINMTDVTINGVPQ